MMMLTMTMDATTKKQRHMSTFIQVMACRLLGDKPLPEAMLTNGPHNDNDRNAKLDQDQAYNKEIYCDAVSLLHLMRDVFP